MTARAHMKSVCEPYDRNTQAGNGYTAIKAVRHYAVCAVGVGLSIIVAAAYKQ